MRLGPSALQGADLKRECGFVVDGMGIGSRGAFLSTRGRRGFLKRFVCDAKERGCLETGQVGEACFHLAGFAVPGIEMDELKALDRGTDPAPLVFLLDNARDLPLAAKGDGPASDGLERQVQPRTQSAFRLPIPQAPKSTARRSSRPAYGWKPSWRPAWPT